MAVLIVEIPEGLEIELRAAGVKPSEVCRRALEHELSKAAAHEEAAAGAIGVAQRLWSDSGRDDRDRQEAGMNLGMSWARDDATLGEMWEVARWHRQRWRQFSLRPESHSLPVLYCTAVGIDPPAPGQDFWLERNPYTLGLVEGVAAVYEQVHNLI